MHIEAGRIENEGITVRANQASEKRILPPLTEYMQAGCIDPNALTTDRVLLEHASDDRNRFSSKLED